jgi:putative zinc finger/helix-turn-helix YgiT family protein
MTSKKKTACVMCGHAMTEKRENRQYPAKVGAILEDVLVRRCPSCGEEEIVIPRVQEVHATVAAGIARQLAPLTPDQIRFLRTHLGYSSVDFARELQVTPETVSRWEGGKVKMSGTTEKLVRLMVLVDKPLASYKLAGPRGARKPAQLRVRESDGRWHIAA